MTTKNRIQRSKSMLIMSKLQVESLPITDGPGSPRYLPPSLATLISPRDPALNRNSPRLSHNRTKSLGTLPKLQEDEPTQASATPRMLESNISSSVDSSPFVPSLSPI